MKGCRCRGAGWYGLGRLMRLCSSSSFGMGTTTCCFRDHFDSRGSIRAVKRLMLVRLMLDVDEKDEHSSAYDPDAYEASKR